MSESSKLIRLPLSLFVLIVSLCRHASLVNIRRVFACTERAVGSVESHFQAIMDVYFVWTIPHYNIYPSTRLFYRQDIDTPNSEKCAKATL